MKVAGGLLLALGGIFIAVAVMFGQDTGRSSPGTMILGIIILVIGIVLFNIKPKDKNKDNNENKS